MFKKLKTIIEARRYRRKWKKIIRYLAINETVKKGVIKEVE